MRTASRSSWSAAAAACPSSGWRRIPPAARARPCRPTGRAGDGGAAVEAAIAPPAADGSPSRAEACWPRRGANTRPAFCRRHRTRPGTRGEPLVGDKPLEAAADVAVDGWTSASPWRLALRAVADVATALVEPVAARYRTTLVLNLGAMALAVAARPPGRARGRASASGCEAQAHEEAHVRDLERQLFHAERLTTAGRLAAGIAHEINNPLEGMANYLSLTRDALERGDVDIRAAAAGERAPGTGPGGPGRPPGARARRSGQAPRARPWTSTACWPSRRSSCARGPSSRASASRARWRRRR